MGLQDQLNNNKDSGGRMFIFTDGVRYKHMTGKDPIIFRFAPAYDPTNEDKGTSYLPFCSPDGVVTDFGRLLLICRFVGHGKGGFGTRRDLLSLRSFAETGQEIFDPLTVLYSTIQSMSQDWGYLIRDMELPGDKRERAAFGRPMPHFIANVLDINSPTSGIQIGIFSKSATDSLTDGKKGLIYQRNAAATPDQIAQNYLSQYATGDLTDPNYGPSLVLQKGNEQGDFSKYFVTLAQDATGGVSRRPLDQELMKGRYDMANPAEFITIPTEEQLVNELIAVLTGRSPQGYHEYALLKQAFPQFKIPEPPAAPAMMGTTQGAGFGGNAAAPTTAQPTAGTPPVAAPVAGTTAAPPPGPVPSTTADPAAGVPPATTAPVAAVPVAAAPVAAVPVAAAPVAAPAAAVATAAPEANTAAANQEAASVAPATPAPAGTPPTAPGDAIPPADFNSEEFLGKLKGMGTDKK